MVSDGQESNNESDDDDKSSLAAEDEHSDTDSDVDMSDSDGASTGSSSKSDAGNEEDDVGGNINNLVAPSDCGAVTDGSEVCSLFQPVSKASDAMESGAVSVQGNDAALLSLDEVAPDSDGYNLRRIPDDIPWNAYLIAIIELAERFSYYGATVVFVNFIQQPLPPGSRTGAPLDADGQAGALNMGQRASTAVTTFNTLWVYITPLVGAYLADAYWGRYKTICIAVGIALVGHVMLIYSALPSTLEDPSYAFRVFLCAILVMGTGTGAFKSNISPLVAEQYRRTKPYVRILDSGERVLVDPSMTIARIYMYFYLFINLGSLTGQISMTYAEKYVGFWLAFTLPTVVFLLCPIILYYGRHRYITSPPAGSSLLLTSLRAFFYAARGKWSVNPAALYNNLSSLTFWEPVKPSNVRGRQPRWMTFDDAFVNELKRGFGACAVFAFLPFYWLPYNQLGNNLTSQASSMQTHGLPNDLLSNIDPIALVILIPLCDKFLYPWLGPRRTTPLKRIALGFAVAAVSMLWATVVQSAVYGTSPCGNFATDCKDASTGRRLVAPVSVWWQTGTYLLIAASEILAAVTGLEYAYSSAPEGMRSVVTALFQSTGAFASLIGECLVWLAGDPLLVWNYVVVGALAGCAGLAFWRVFKAKDAEDEAKHMASGGE
ncbi:peptide transporter PTR2A [Auricularia subglabra TFB-10046 SS5]|nr:peptide transporter PTR2A [Auricularia subglabra TFB-10046 SS5]